LCFSKSNYAEIDPPARLFELRDGFHWVGVDFDLLAEDLYTRSRLRGRPAEKKDLVKAEILRLLSSGEPMLSNELETEVCKFTGCHINTLAMAKKELGVESYQSGRLWYCRLPGQNTINTQTTIISEDPQSQ
jgi:hypothetical protein